MNFTLFSNNSRPVEPYSFQEALKSPQRDHWTEAIDKELNNLQSMGTWEVCDCPPDRKPIGSKWVFKIKRHPDGSIDKYKARLVAQGFSQRPGVDFTLIYAPVIRYDTLRIFLTIVACLDLELHSMDVVGAYLYGNLSSSSYVYMRMPPGFEQKNKCLRLRRTLYGLKQSGYEWNKVFDDFIRTLGFHPLPNEPCLYMNQSEKGPIFLALYVDDILLAAKDVSAIDEIKQQLFAKFKMEDKGDASSILGMSITRDREKRTLSLSHSGSVLELLREHNQINANPRSIPMTANLILSKQDGPSNEEEEETMKRRPYQRIIGQLMYLALTSRPDINFSVCKLAKYVSNPGPRHWNALISVLRSQRYRKLRNLPGRNRVQKFG
jgi:hypothetical protein